MKISIEKQDLKLLLLSDATKPIYLYQDDEGNLSLRGTDAYSIFDINVELIMDNPDDDPDEIDVDLPYYFDYHILHDINKLATEKSIFINLVSNTDIHYTNKRFTNEPQYSTLFHIDMNNYVDSLDESRPLFETKFNTTIYTSVLSKFQHPEMQIVAMNNNLYMVLEEDTRKTYSILPLKKESL